MNCNLKLLEISEPIQIIQVENLVRLLKMDHKQLQMLEPFSKSGRGEGVEVLNSERVSIADRFVRVEQVQGPPILSHKHLQLSRHFLIHELFQRFAGHSQTK